MKRPRATINSSQERDIGLFSGLFGRRQGLQFLSEVRIHRGRATTGGLERQTVLDRELFGVRVCARQEMRDFPLLAIDFLDDAAWVRRHLLGETQFIVGGANE